MRGATRRCGECVNGADGEGARGEMPLVTGSRAIGRVVTGTDVRKAMMETQDNGGEGGEDSDLGTNNGGRGEIFEEVSAKPMANRHGDRDESDESTRATCDSVTQRDVWRSVRQL